MKKLIGAAIIVVFMAGSNLVFAFTSNSISTITATATTIGTGEVAMTVELRNCLDDSTTGWIYWSAVTLPAGWTVSDAYILLSSTISVAGGIQIYTDNLAGDADPSYTGSATSKAGLIDIANTTSKLPIGWLIVDTSTDSITAANPDDSANWFWFKDPGNTGGDAMTNGEDYVTVKDQNGIHFAQGGSWGSAVSPDKILIEADFGTAVVGRTYRTSTLRLEAYTE